MSYELLWSNVSLCNTLVRSISRHGSVLHAHVLCLEGGEMEYRATKLSQYLSECYREKKKRITRTPTFFEVDLGSFFDNHAESIPPELRTEIKQQLALENL